MIRARFKEPSYDYRPVEWPIKYPYWCTGEGYGYYTLVAYADSVEDIKRLWPTAIDIEWDEVEGIVFTSRFPKPDWYSEESK